MLPKVNTMQKGILKGVLFLPQFAPLHPVGNQLHFFSISLVCHFVKVTISLILSLPLIYFLFPPSSLSERYHTFLLLFFFFPLLILSP